MPCRQPLCEMFSRILRGTPLIPHIRLRFHRAVWRHCSTISTLYPILHALEQDKRVKSYEKEAPTGRMRKYYHITKSGLELLEEKQEEWKLFSEKVNGVVFGEVPTFA